MDWNSTCTFWADDLARARVPEEGPEHDSAVTLTAFFNVHDWNDLSIKRPIQLDGRALLSLLRLLAKPSRNLKRTRLCDSPSTPFGLPVEK